MQSRLRLKMPEKGLKIKRKLNLKMPKIQSTEKLPLQAVIIIIMGTSLVERVMRTSRIFMESTRPQLQLIIKTVGLKQPQRKANSSLKHRIDSKVVKDHNNLQ